MAFGVEGLDNADQERYCTWDEAGNGHECWVMKIFKATPILALPQSEESMMTFDTNAFISHAGGSFATLMVAKVIGRMVEAQVQSAVAWPTGERCLAAYFDLAEPDRRGLGRDRARPGRGDRGAA